MTQATSSVKSSHKPWLVLLVVLSGQFMASLDTTIANVAVNNIGTRLSTSSGAVQLAILTYTLIYASLLITGARLGADQGRRKIFQIGVALFTVASGIVGLAPDIAVLVAGRAVQGLGAALMVPQIVSIIQVSFTGRPRSRALAAFSAMIAIGASAGLVLGGILIDINLFGWGWRTVFLINVPIGIALFAVAAVVLPTVPLVSRPLDLPGVGLLTLGGILVTLALTQGGDHRWPAWTILLGLLGLGVIMLFAVHQRRKAAAGRTTLINPGLFTTPGIRPGLTALILITPPYTGILFCAALDLQHRLHASAAVAGLALLPLAGGLLVSSSVFGMIPPTTHHRFIVGGLLLASVCLFGLAWLVSRNQWPGVSTELVLAGAGLGFGVFAGVMGLIVSNVQLVHVPDASGMATTTLQFGLVIGTAVFGSIYTLENDLSVVLAVMAIPVLCALVPVYLHRRRYATAHA